MEPLFDNPVIVCQNESELYHYEDKSYIFIGNTENGNPVLAPPVDKYTGAISRKSAFMFQRRLNHFLSTLTDDIERYHPGEQAHDITFDEKEVKYELSSFDDDGNRYHGSGKLPWEYFDDPDDYIHKETLRKLEEHQNNLKKREQEKLEKERKLYEELKRKFEQ